MRPANRDRERAKREASPWIPLVCADMVAVARPEEQIFYLDPKVEGTPGAEFLAKLLNDRAALLEELKAFLEASPCTNGCGPGDHTCASRRAEMAIRKAEALP